MLYSYCLRYDDGAAPNPFWGVCTLAICKPVIRRTAQVGDWVVGTGSVETHSAGRIVYAMRVDQILSMAEYDNWTQTHLAAKSPDWQSRDHRRRLGDSIYDFSTDPPRLRQSVHEEGNVDTDLGGARVLLGRHFYYLGDQAKELPDDLLPIVKQGQGHRSWSNERYAASFVAWLEGLALKSGIHGRPQLNLFQREELAKACAHGRRAEGDEDEREGDDCPV